MKELDQFANRLAAVGTRLIEADLEQTPIAKLSAKLPSQAQALADYIAAEKRGLGNWILLQVFLLFNQINLNNQEI